MALFKVNILDFLKSTDAKKDAKKRPWDHRNDESVLWINLVELTKALI
jgi:hypothetical protein